MTSSPTERGWSRDRSPTRKKSDSPYSHHSDKSHDLPDPHVSPAPHDFRHSQPLPHEHSSASGKGKEHEQAGNKYNDEELSAVITRAKNNLKSCLETLSTQSGTERRKTFEDMEKAIEPVLKQEEGIKAEIGRLEGEIKKLKDEVEEHNTQLREVRAFKSSLRSAGGRKAAEIALNNAEAIMRGGYRERKWPAGQPKSRYHPYDRKSAHPSDPSDGSSQRGWNRRFGQGSQDSNR